MRKSNIQYQYEYEYEYSLSELFNDDGVESNA